MTTTLLPTWAREVGATVYLTADNYKGGPEVNGKPAKIIKVSAAMTQVTVQRTELEWSAGEATEVVKTYRFKTSDSWKDSTKMKLVAGEPYASYGLVSEGTGNLMIEELKTAKEIASLKGTASAIAARLSNPRSVNIWTSDIETAIEQLSEVLKAMKELGAK